jgi:4-hydroxyacetophenone monooxygenase
MIADEDAGLAPEIQAEIRAEAARLIAERGHDPAIGDPGDALTVEMMSACLGEEAPPEYAPMMREEMGFSPRQVTWTAPATPPAAEAPVIIVGAGASGIALGANLEQLGIPYIILEKNPEVGGTWLENRYPGCAVDTPNHAYSFSFGKPYRWQSYFSPRDQIFDYLKQTATDTGVRSNIRFGATVTKADWDDSAKRWRVVVMTETGEEQLDGMAFVSAIGQLSLPAVPPIDGVEDFGGPLFHSAQWPEGLDLNGKRIAVIGTGASAMQIVPTIADDVAQLTVYQRSPQWARPVPRYHDQISDDAQWLLENVPLYRAWFRFTMLWRYGDGLHPFLQKDPDWPHPERSLNKVNDRHREQMTDHIVAELGDRTDLLEKCLPSYPPYGKRILLDNGWYRTITQDHVELVTDPVDRVDGAGVRTADGVLREADVIVLATGFKVEIMAARLNITGREGRRLEQDWADENPTAYVGIAVPGYPNFFCMQGPNTGLGHGGSAIFQSECQARYIVSCIVAMLEQGIVAIDVKQPAHDDYVARVDAHHERMVWTHPGMSTYYRNRFGRAVSVMPWRLVDYWGQTHDPDLADYHLTYGNVAERLAGQAPAA